MRDHFFGKDPRTKAMVADMTDDEIWALRRGGLDTRKVYAAYKVATELNNGKPTVILAKTIKGWTLGPDVEGRNATHQIKTLTNQQLMTLRETLHLDQEIPAESLEGESEPPYFRPGPGTPEYEYLHQRRQELGGLLPCEGRPETRPRTAGPGGLCRDPRRVGEGRGLDDHGLHPSHPQPVTGRGLWRPDRADSPGRGPHLRYGLAVPRAQDLRLARPALRIGRCLDDPLLRRVPRRPDPGRGNHRSRLGRLLDRGCHLVCDPRPARWSPSSSSTRCSASNGLAT